MSRFARTPQKTARARKLRQETTPAEARLWLQLRSGKLGASFRRQHPIGPYYVDFCCTALKVVIELDGSQHARRTAYDAARTAFLEARGYRVIRFWNGEVMEELDGVCEQVAWAVKRRQFEQSEGTDPLPTSPLQGEE